VSTAITTCSKVHFGSTTAAQTIRIQIKCHDKRTYKLKTLRPTLAYLYRSLQT